MSPKAKNILGWILTGLLGFFLIVISGSGKFMDWEGKAEMFDKMGIKPETSIVVGVIEIVATLLFLIPRTSFVGAILVTGYLGGAVWTHLRVGDTWFFPIVIGVVVWTALGLRYPAIFQLALGKTSSGGEEPSDKSS